MHLTHVVPAASAELGRDAFAQNHLPASIPEGLQLPRIEVLPC
jgi:hypothetical protein